MYDFSTNGFVSYLIIFRNATHETVMQRCDKEAGRGMPVGTG